MFRYLYKSIFMKNSLRKLISEEIQKVRLEILEENIVSDILAVILSPKVKKAMKALKDDPEFKELEKQAKLAQQELEAINKRIERNLEKRDKAMSDMQKSGIKVNSNMSAEQMFKAYKDWQANLNKTVGLKSSGIKDWQKYFK